LAQPSAYHWPNNQPTVGATISLLLAQPSAYHWPNYQPTVVSAEAQRPKATVGQQSQETMGQRYANGFVLLGPTLMYYFLSPLFKSSLIKYLLELLIQHYRYVETKYN